jgi:transcriptional regulator with XRE-family HTH domain
MLARRGREKVDDSQETAARKLEIEQPNVSNAENGHRSAEKTLFRLIEMYTDFKVDDTRHYRLIEK